MSLSYAYLRCLLLIAVYLAINYLILKIESGKYFSDKIMIRSKFIRPTLSTKYIMKSNLTKVMTYKSVRFKSMKSRQKKLETSSISSYECKVSNTANLVYETFQSTDYKENFNVQQIADTCKEHNFTTNHFAKNFAYNSKDKALLCWVHITYKFFIILLYMEMSKITRNQRNDVKLTSCLISLANFVVSHDVKILKTVIDDPKILKILIVRHPFERLVSVYRNIIEENEKYIPQSWVYMLRIFRTMRPKFFQTQGLTEKIFSIDKRSKLIPSFEEFIQWILLQDSSTANPLWDQYYAHCSLCSISYDHVLRVENRKFSRLFSKQGSLQKIPLLEKINWDYTDFACACNYFKNLSHVAAVDLYNKYRTDFETFDYDFDKYIECTDLG